MAYQFLRLKYKKPNNVKHVYVKIWKIHDHCEDKISFLAYREDFHTAKQIIIKKFHNITSQSNGTNIF